MKSAYDPTDNEIIVANIGRKLMNESVKLPKKGHKPTNEEIARSNRMSAFGDTLTRFGTPYGPKNLKEVLKSANITKKEAEEFMQIGYSA
ncbi:MAG TPA: hypothetical protein DCW83_05980 [Saprospirales bacterium]|jgi:hypothetical protein|nr:hypothetical protein [Saprospirales bacterium]